MPRAMEVITQGEVIMDGCQLYSRVVSKQVSGEVKYSNRTCGKEGVVYAEVQVEEFWAEEMVNNGNGSDGNG